MAIDQYAANEGTLFPKLNTNYWDGLLPVYLGHHFFPDQGYGLGKLLMT
jgi:hypothetical protein